MRWIGLTGGISTGKSTVSRLLRGWGYPVLDADALAREILEPLHPGKGFDRVCEAFGSQILMESKANSAYEIDRQKLAKVIFQDSEKRLLLESIVHPLIQEEVLKRKVQLRDQGVPWAFYDVPLLFEKKLQTQFDAVILVTCSEEHQIERMRRRNAWSEDEIRGRLQAQMPLNEKERLAPYIIWNDKSLSDLELETRRVLGEMFSNFQQFQ